MGNCGYNPIYYRDKDEELFHYFKRKVYSLSLLQESILEFIANYFHEAFNPKITNSSFGSQKKEKSITDYIHQRLLFFWKVRQEERLKTCVSLSFTSLTVWFLNEGMALLYFIPFKETQD
jgi:hypothetical protein